MKTCADCKETKPLDEFPHHKKSKDGRSHVCNVCNRIRASRWQKENPERYKERQREYSESGKKAVASKKEYAKHRESYIQRVKNWIAGNSERHHEHVSAWMKRNPDKMQTYRENRRGRVASAGEYTQAEWESLCEFYGHICLCCKESKPLTVDHVVPLSKGGSNTIDNLQPLCASCNSRKNQKIIDYRL